MAGDLVVDFNVLALPYVSARFQVSGGLPSDKYVWADGQQLDVTGDADYDLLKTRMGFSNDGGTQTVQIPLLNMPVAPAATDTNAQDWWIVNPSTYSDITIHEDGRVVVAGLDVSNSSSFILTGIVGDFAFLNNVPLSAIDGTQLQADATLVESNINFLEGTTSESQTGLSVTVESFQPTASSSLERKWIIAVKGV